MEEFNTIPLDNGNDEDKIHIAVCAVGGGEIVAMHGFLKALCGLIADNDLPIRITQLYGKNTCVENMFEPISGVNVIKLPASLEEIVQNIPFDVSKNKSGIINSFFALPKQALTYYKMFTGMSRTSPGVNEVLLDLIQSDDVPDIFVFNIYFDVFCRGVMEMIKRQGKHRVAYNVTQFGDLRKPARYDKSGLYSIDGVEWRDLRNVMINLLGLCSFQLTELTASIAAFLRGDNPEIPFPTSRYNPGDNDGTIYANGLPGTGLDILNPEELMARTEALVTKPDIVTLEEEALRERIRSGYMEDGRRIQNVCAYIRGSMDHMSVDYREKSRELVKAAAEKNPDTLYVVILQENFEEYNHEDLNKPNIIRIPQFIDLEEMFRVVASVHSIEGIHTVHHGGMGTTVTFANYGIPSFVLTAKNVSEQTGNARTYGRSHDNGAIDVFDTIDTQTFLDTLSHVQRLSVEHNPKFRELVEDSKNTYPGALQGALAFLWVVYKLTGDPRILVHTIRA